LQKTGLNKGCVEGSKKKQSLAIDNRASSHIDTVVRCMKLSASTSTPSNPARRAPIGKVIHYFADTQNSDHPQGYDGLKFQEYYQELALKASAEGPSQARSGKEEDASSKGDVEAVATDEDVEEMVSERPSLSSQAEALHVWIL